MRNLLIEDENDESTIPDEGGGNLKMAVGATNIRKKMVYSRKVFAVLTAVFLVYAIGNMILFITPGVREFVQQYRLIYIFLPLPIVSRILISAVERLHHIPPILIVFPIFLLHLLAIFLSFTCFSLDFDTELVYFSCFVICGNFFQLLLYTFQNVYYFSPLTMFIFLIVTSVSNAFFLQITLAIFDFPIVEVVLISLLSTMYIHTHIQHFMNSFSSKDWPLATVSVFTRIPI